MAEFKCECCCLAPQETVTGTKITRMEEAPAFLYIPLYRDDEHPRSQVFYLPHLSLQDASNHAVEYELQVVVVFSGTDNKGHFVAHRKFGEKWWLCNDSAVGTFCILPPLQETRQRTKSKIGSNASRWTKANLCNARKFQAQNLDRKYE